MDVDAIRKELGLSKADLARKLGVSSGHAADLCSGRRELSLKLAAKLETERPGLIAAAVAERTGAAA